MRKIKITALILAVLMLMAAFVGCASTGSVEELANKLDEHLNDASANQEKTDKTLEELAALIAGLTAAQDQANKDAEADNKAVLDAIDKLTDKIEALEKENKDEDASDKDAAALEAAKKTYTAKLQEMKIACELDKDAYVPSEYSAVITALSTGINAVDAAKTADEAKTAYDTAAAVYTEKATVLTRLVTYYGQVKNNVTKDSKTLIDEIKVYLNGKASPSTNSALKDAFGVTQTNGSKLSDVTAGIPETITKYKDGSKTINLVAELYKAIDAYDYAVETSNGLKALVKDAVDAIKGADVKTVKLAQASAVTRARAAYKDVETAVKGNGTHAAYLADSQMDLVTNYATLTAAEARLEKLTVALAMYPVSVGDPDGNGNYKSAFDKYDALVTDKKAIDLDKKVSVYDAINTKLDAWIAEYELDAVNVTYIVDKVENAGTTGFYADYQKDNHEVQLVAKAADSFKTIVDRIKALQSKTTLDTATFTEYGAIANAIKNWMVLQPASANNENVLLRDKIELSNFNFAQIIKQYKLNNTDAFTFDGVVNGAHATEADYQFQAIPSVVEAADYTFDNSFFALYKFASAAINSFFQTTYKAANDDANKINAVIKLFKPTDLRSVLEIISLSGEYSVSGSVYTKVASGTVGTATYTGALKDAALTAAGFDPRDSSENTIKTIAQFNKDYVEGELYDLTSLVKVDDYNAALKAVEDKITEQKKTATEIKDLVAKIEKDLKKTGDPTDVDQFTATIVGRLDLAGYAADINNMYTKYLNAVATAGINNIQEFVLKTNETTKYEFKLIIDTAAVRKLDAYKTEIAKLEAMVKELEAIYAAVTAVNTYKPFEVATIATATTEYKASATASSTTTYYYYDATGAKKTATNASDVITQMQLIEALYSTDSASEGKYVAFVKDNNNKTYAPVEELKASVEALVFKAFLSKVVDVVAKLDTDSTEGGIQPIANLDAWVDQIAATTTLAQVQQIYADLQQQYATLSFAEVSLGDYALAAYTPAQP